MKIVRVVGCGSIGANLCLNFCKLGLFEEVHVYDDDIVSYTKSPEFPFQQTFVGFPKVEALSLLVQSLRLDSNIKLFIYEKKVLHNLNNSGLIIDCRDNKYPVIRSDIRCSMDNNVLYVDCRDHYDPQGEISEYVEQRDSQFTDFAISIITAFILDHMYEEGKFKMFDLKRMLQSGIDLT